jgi:hypothetical protein
VNDLFVQDAELLYFRNYYACSKLDVTLAADVVKGIARGCQQVDCALVGGETTEMPGMYPPGARAFLPPTITQTHSLTRACGSRRHRQCCWVARSASASPELLVPPTAAMTTQLHAMPTTMTASSRVGS